MKTIRKNFLLLAFAAGALFLIGNNVFGSDPGESENLGDERGGSWHKSCMKSGGGVVAFAYRCDDPGYPTLPPYKCGAPLMIRSGNGLSQCY
jgi:hypothetical protein